MSRRDQSWLVLLARIAILALCCAILVAPASRAQSVGGIPGFLQDLFGFSARHQASPQRDGPLRSRAHKLRKREQDFVSTTSTRAPGSPGGAAVRPVFFVSVLGDSLAILTAQGLAEAFADRPEVSIIDLAHDLSGLTRSDYFNWPIAVRDLVAGKQKIDVAVIMIGINDLQALRDGSETLDPLSDKWRTVYARRVEDLIAPLRDAHIPVLWVGLPSMQDDRFNEQVIALNEIYRDHVEKAEGKYVDIWDGFVDQSGHYAAFGPDVNGQTAKLRSGASGIYFTSSGSRKVAEFLAPDIRRVLEKTNPQENIASLPPDIEEEANDINAEIRREIGADNLPPGAIGSVPRPVAGPILSLTARPTSARGALVETVNAAKTSLGEEALSPGSETARPAGRADDFAWPQPR